MSSIKRLPLPFASWREGLLILAAALTDPNREKIIVARLESSGTKVALGLREICALALLVPSRAHFPRSSLPKHEPDPIAVAAGAMLSEEFNRHMEEIGKADDAREKIRVKLYSIFPERDPRVILKDTILSFATIQLLDLSQHLSDSDPFSRLARRLCLWFKPWLDFSRYGIEMAANGSAIIGAVRHAVKAYNGDDSARIQNIVRIWSGEVPVEPNATAIKEIASLFKHGHLESLLVLESFTALLEDIDSLSRDALEEISEGLKWMPAALEDGFCRPCTSNIQTWIESWSEDNERLRLTYDPSRAFSAAMFSESADILEPLLISTLEAMEQEGQTVFATGAFPIRGGIFQREGPLYETLSERAPEAAELIRLLSADGDHGELHGPYAFQWYWTGEGNPDAITILDVIDKANNRNDHALSDMLIGCWILYCTLYEQAPLIDLSTLANRINALPLDYRSSTYGALSVLRRETAGNLQLSHNVDALLSWLSVIEAAPAEDCGRFMRELFSPHRWDILQPEEQQRLVSTEELFIEMRRLTPEQRKDQPLHPLIIDWSVVAEQFLLRAITKVAPSIEVTREQRTLGRLINRMRTLQGREKDSWIAEMRQRMQLIPDALNMLDQLNQTNRTMGKHLDSSTPLTWNRVMRLHAGLYWALPALLDIASNP